MNVMAFGKQTGEHDWIPDRAIGPTDDVLYESENDYNDAQIGTILKKPLDEVQNMPTSEKRDILMENRRKELKKLIGVYYAERGWNESVIPKIETLKALGLWDFLRDEAKAKIRSLNF